jgi:hypothetical protein
VSQPEQPPRFFLDRSLGRRAALSAGPEALRADGWDVITLAEHYGIPADEQVADKDRIEEAAKRGWPIPMKDKRIRYRQAEITAVTEHKARCFVITRGDLLSADMAQRFIAHKAAILLAAAEPAEKGDAVARDHHLAGEEPEGVPAVDWRDQVRQQVVEHLAASDDLSS